MRMQDVRRVHAERRHHHRPLMRLLGVDRTSGEVSLHGSDCRLTVDGHPVEPWEFSQLAGESDV